MTGEIERVNFAFDSIRLDTNSEQKLEATATALINCGTETLMVQGHTDSIGSYNYNQSLSEE